MFGILPDDVVYRMKAPLQYGAWTYRLADNLSGLVKGANELGKIEQETGLLETYDRLAHAGLYKIYRGLGLTPPKVTDRANQFECNSCSGAIEKGFSFCYTCGLSGERVVGKARIGDDRNN